MTLICFQLGTYNHRAPPPFDCLPLAGVIEANSTQDLIVTFCPDHQSEYYADTLDIKLYGQSAYTLDIVGRVWGNNMYSLVPPKFREDEWKKELKIQPLHFEFIDFNADDSVPPPPEPLILLFTFHTSTIKYKKEYDIDDITETEAPPSAGKDRSVSGKGKGRVPSAPSSRGKIVKEVEVGCIKTALVKKVCEESLSLC